MSDPTQNDVEKEQKEETETSISSAFYEEMLKSGVHYGRKKTVFNPGMSGYVFGVRDRIHIIDLIKTEEQLKKATKFMNELKSDGKVILWVALTKQAEDKIKEIAIEFKMPYVTDKWLGGMLTNFKIIKERIDHYKLMLTKKENEYEKMTKKERHDFDIEMKRMSQKYEGIKNLDKLPDAIFFASLKEATSPVHEAKVLGIKTISIVNTESDPSAVNYPIPANDNARQAINFVLEVIRKELEN